MNQPVGGLLAAFSRTAGQVIAAINPETQRAIYTDTSFAELKRQHPDLELESAHRAVEIVEALHITAPEEISAEQYEQALSEQRPRERIGTTFLARPLVCGSVGTFYTCLSNRYYRMQQRITMPLDEAWRTFDKAIQAAEEVHTEDNVMEPASEPTAPQAFDDQRAAA